MFRRMKLNKNIFFVVVICIAYVASREVAGDAKLLADTDYIKNLGFLDIGWRTLVTIKTNILGNTDIANIIYIYMIQLVGLIAIYNTANKTNNKLLTALLLTTLLVPIAIRIQLRLGFSISLWLFSVTDYWVNKKMNRFLLTSIFASSMHQGIAVVNAIVLFNVFSNKLNLNIIRIRLPKKLKILYFAFILILSLGLSTEFMPLAINIFTALSDKVGNLLPTISTLSSVVNKSDSFYREGTFKLLSILYTLTLLVLAYFANSYRERYLGMAYSKEVSTYKLYSIFSRIFIITAFFNIVFSGLEYFGRIGTLCYPIYALIIIFVDIGKGTNEKGIRNINHLYYTIPSIMGAVRFLES